MKTGDFKNLISCFEIIENSFEIIFRFIDIGLDYSMKLI